MSKLLGRAGVWVFWLTWPGIWLIMRFSRRSRVIILTPDGKVLLVKGWLAAGQWFLPGGGIHRGESAEQGALREVFEETGIQLGVKDLQKVAEGRMSDHGLSFQSIVFVARLPHQPELRLQKYEVSNLAWTPLDELHDLSPLTKKLIDQWTKGM